MQVILTQDIKNLGQKWDICEVKPGYFRNHLSPSGLAVLPTAKRLAEAEQHIAARAHKMEEIKSQAAEIKASLAGTTLTFARKTTESGDTLYAAIHTSEIAEALKEQAKLDLDAKHIHLQEQIKTVGLHTVTLELAEGVEVEVKAEVLAE